MVARGRRTSCRSPSLPGPHSDGRRRSFDQGRAGLVEVDVKELDKIVDASREQPLTEEEANKLRTAIHAMAERRTSEKLDKIIDEVSEKDPEGKPKALIFPVVKILFF